MLGIRDMLASGKGRNKELQHLSRQDLLELLVQQLHESDELRIAIEQKERDIEEQADLIARLKERLDLKDEKIDGLKDRLEGKDDQIARLTARLDDKDGMLERLKRRLDAKDVLIARVVEASGIDPMAIELFEAQQRSGDATEDGGDRHE